MEERKRIGLYSPYIPEHAGGGERYLFSVAEIASEMHDVTVLVRQEMREEELRKRYEEAFRLDLTRVRFTRTSIGTDAPFWKKILETARYDMLYYLTDGSLFFSLAKRNILHIQFPFTFHIRGFTNRLKLANWNIRNANSLFTKRVVERAWEVPIQYVHYPYVDTQTFKPLAKEPMILSVGRFFTGERSGTHCKRQDVLVNAFARMVDQAGLTGWKLVLIGSVDPGEDNREYAEKVAEMAKGYPIKILHNATFDVLRQYYAHASIYWHAAGYQIDEQKEPKKVEHFGISTIEAMASGGVPIVVGKGGLKEIVEYGVNGFLWEDEDELISYTQKLIKDKVLLRTMQENARKRAGKFGKKQFAQTLREMV